MSQKSNAKVLELFISVKGESDRVAKDELIVDTQGVIGDKFYAKNSDRPILITSIQSYTIASNHGINTPHSSLGENILLDVSPYHLTPGDRLEIGETLLEITQNCTICNSLSKVDPSLPKLLENDRGIFAKVIKQGVIKKDDIVNFYTQNKENT